uniref:Transmembrane and coiled-coil domain-containing protein 5B n=1 Tax=Zea mays TaxID=4577 RepID=A0A804Q747_MAIZE
KFEILASSLAWLFIPTFFLAPSVQRRRRRRRLIAAGEDGWPRRAALRVRLSGPVTLTSPPPAATLILTLTGTSSVTSGRSCACCGLSRVGPTRTGRRSVSRSLPDIQTMLEETQLKFEEERQNSLKVLSNTSKEQCESSLNEEYSKFQETYDTFCKEKDAHMQTFRDLLSKVEVEKKKLLEKYEHHMEEETNTLSELDETISEKVTHAEHSVRRVNQDGKSFIVFRKSTGLFLDCGSDDDFDLDEWRC